MHTESCLSDGRWTEPYREGRSEREQFDSYIERRLQEALFWRRRRDGLNGLVAKGMGAKSE